MQKIKGSIGIYSGSCITANIQAINEAGDKYLSDIQIKGTEVLKSIPDDYTSLANDVDDVKAANAQLNDDLGEFHNDVENKLGNVKATIELVENHYGVGAINDGAIGAKISIGTQSYWTYSVFDVNEYEEYQFITNTTNTNKGYYVFYTDENDFIVARELHGNTSDDWVITHYTKVPKSASKMYIVAFANMTNIQLRMKVWKIKYIDLQTQINNISEDEMPSYYREHINEKIEEIKNNTRILNGMSFAFITDTHVSSNSLNSKYLMADIFNKTTVPFGFFGGDVVRAYGTKEDIVSDTNTWFEYVKYLHGKLYCMHGNHDFTIKKSANENIGYTFSKSFTYDYVTRSKELDVVGLKGHNCYYIDNKIQKIRLICLDEWETVNEGENPWGVSMMVGQEQLDWFIEALSVDNYTFVVFTHHTINPNLTGSGGMLHIQGILSALNNRTTFTWNNWGTHFSVDFTASTSYCACNICGHAHKDESGVIENVLSIITTCDAHYQDDGHGAVIGTITEQAFDVFTVDTENRIIRSVRIGRGNNREWSY